MTGTGLRIDQVTKFMSRPAALLTLTRSPSFKKPAPLSTMRSPASTPPTTSIDSSCMAPVSTRRRATMLSSLEHEHVAVAVGADDALERHHVGGPVPISISPRANMPGRNALVGRQIDVDERRAVVRRDRRRDDADRAVERRAVGRHDADALPGRQVVEPRLGRFAAPFDAAVAQQAQHLVAGLRDLADGDRARRDDAVIGRRRRP